MINLPWLIVMGGLIELLTGVLRYGQGRDSNYWMALLIMGK